MSVLLLPGYANPHQIYTLLPACMSLAAALPSPLTKDAMPLRRAAGNIQILPADVHGPETGALRPVPADLSSSLHMFLEKYQPLANAASAQIGAKQSAVFTSAGHCFTDYPCFSVERGAMASIGDKEEVSQEQVSAILDRLTTTPTVTFEHDATAMLSGLKLTHNQATLEVIATQGTMPSNLLAGMVFDMYKMQHDDPSTNSIRAVQAATDGQERPFVALCLYPEGANAAEARNFCLGNELDGQRTTLTQDKSKRFSIEHGLNFLCGLVKLPLLCHDNQ